MMKNLIAIILFLLLPAIATQAAAEKDILTQMVEQINSKPTDYNESEYHSVTISPDMMKRVLALLNSGDVELPIELSSNKEDLAKMLSNVKSMRILLVKDSPDKYKALVNNLVKANKSKYKEIKTKDPSLQANNTIWARKSHNSIVEILLVQNQNGGLQIMNMTGSFPNEFINMLQRL